MLSLDDWLQQTMSALLDDNLTRLSEGRATGDWPIESTSAWHTALGPALAGAALWRLHGSSKHRDWVMSTVQRLWPMLQARRGRFARARTRFGLAPLWNDRAVIEAGATLSWIYLLMEQDLTDVQAREWRGVLTGMRADLCANRNFNYYINGNYQIPLVELAYGWHLFTPEATPPHLYDNLVRLMDVPALVASKWQGYGWSLQRPSSMVEWREGAGYYSEVPAPTFPPPGNTFDPEYVQLQLERMTRLWLLTDEQRFLDRARGVLDALLPLVDSETWRCDCSQGSRKSTNVVFGNAGFSVLALMGGRDDIDPGHVRSQVSTAVRDDLERTTHLDAYRLRSYGLCCFSILLATSQPLRAYIGQRRALGRLIAGSSYQTPVRLGAHD